MYRNIRKHSVITALLFILGLLSAFAWYQFYLNFDTPWQHFSEQADRFMIGEIDPTQSPPHDLVFVEGKYYWPNGPFPTAFILSFKIVFGEGFEQAIAQMLSILGVLYFAFRLARLKGFDTVSSTFLVFALCCGSFLLPIFLNPKSWFFSQVIAVLFLLGILYEWETKKRPFVLGVLLAGIFGTRPTSGVIMLMISYFFLVWNESVLKKLQRFSLFLLPIGVAGFLLILFNYVRFGDFFDNGYYTNNIGGISEPLRQIGVFSLQHIPMNFYWYFLSTFEPVTEGSAHIVFPYITYSKWGLSLIFCAPVFFLSLKTLFSTDHTIRALWIIVGITLLILLMYFNTGWVSYGPRYAGDFLPIVYLLLLYALRKPRIPTWTMMLILLSGFVNLFVLYQFPTH